MSQRLTAAVEELRAEKARIQADVCELRRQIKSGETQLKQIQKALCVLNDSPRAKSPNKKPAATRREVVKAMSDVLKENGPLEETELKRLVGEQLASVGKSQMGFALRFKEALNDGRFARREDGLIGENVRSASA